MSEDQKPLPNIKTTLFINGREIEAVDIKFEYAVKVGFETDFRSRLHSALRDIDFIELRIIIQEPPTYAVEAAPFAYSDDLLARCPIGTIAPAISGGRWYKTEHGWQWNGPDGCGDTFPMPGGDWTGQLIKPPPRLGDDDDAARHEPAGQAPAPETAPDQHGLL